MPPVDQEGQLSVLQPFSPAMLLILDVVKCLKQSSITK